ncbi:hypothetical protein BDW72DRAFT_188340 [Aspergillus terricola var. indicus]
MRYLYNGQLSPFKRGTPKSKMNSPKDTPSANHSANHTTEVAKCQQSRLEDRMLIDELLRQNREYQVVIMAYQEKIRRWV